MAASAEEFLATMKGEGTDVQVVSLLGASLSDPFDPPDADVYQSWLDAYSPTTPVLQDRGFGYAMFPDFAKSETGESFGYPTWAVVDPQMNIVAVNVGFGSWDEIANIIRAGQ